MTLHEQKTTEPYTSYKQFLEDDPEYTKELCDQYMDEDLETLREQYSDKELVHKLLEKQGQDWILTERRFGGFDLRALEQSKEYVYVIIQHPQDSNSEPVETHSDPEKARARKEELEENSNLNMNSFEVREMVLEP